MNKVFIYGLVDPRNNQVRYIGKTKSPQKRLINHIFTAKNSNTKKAIWINELASCNLTPIMNILEECSQIEAYEKEDHWINKFDNLTNSSIKNNVDAGNSSITVYLSQDKKNELLTLTSELNITPNEFVGDLVSYILEAYDCLRLVQQLAGKQDWREWLERAAEVMKDD